MTGYWKGEGLRGTGCSCNDAVSAAALLVGLLIGGDGNLGGERDDGEGVHYSEEMEWFGRREEREAQVAREELKTEV